ncbi:MFS transporter, partial [Chromobacterium amazonense]|uniref:MFS transporter n=1 Tax=Chromobacterium amazonense TaxID=1382803 RepID=UPI0031F716FA
MIALTHENKLAKPAWDARAVDLGRGLDARRNAGWMWLSTQEQVAIARLGKALAANQKALVAGELVIGGNTEAIGERKLFVWATLAFVITSLLCGLAQSMGMLVLSRALQGFVAGPMYPITQSLLVSIYPREKRGQALALLAMITVVAPICGPILGGWITDNYSWEWIFLINVPLGIFAALVVGNQLKGRPEQIEKPKMD